ncbi:MAG: hypothetical protein O3A25_02870 [Acidobacteria bacterium]|nr:hypothetical protein [Acidobacteriota bacterium]
MKYRRLANTGTSEEMLQLNDNLGSIDLTLTDDEFDRLNTVSALQPEYPGWMQAMQDTDRAPGTARDWDACTIKRC